MSLMQKTIAELVALVETYRKAMPELDRKRKEAEASVERLTEQLASVMTPIMGVADGWEDRLLEALRPFASKAVLRAADIRCMQPTEGVNIGVRVEVLRNACALVEEYDER